ncbi:SDR family oxidoreductase [Demequina sp. SYSU T00068]|uniref:SDR family oxidoreductase n=1 Tax=Demequina lignilytica TaxID=3051663 RepID=UPI00262092EE|nr:SDR family oxidoreductase [Demequina sp. SYSU T00068]MDN4490876.1 SDR family oxidoreductase [Demequina sp. SYSU T00068]
MAHSIERVAIVGGAGKIARKLIPLLLHEGVEVVALARHDDQLSELGTMGAIPRRLDIEAAQPAAFAAAFGGCDAIVFSAGGGPDGNAERKQTVDLEGSLKSQEAAMLRGVHRFVQVSAIGVDNPPDPGLGEVWTAYVEAKRRADEALRRSSFAWTIIRPGTLTDAVGTGCVNLGPEVPHHTIPRIDVAKVIAGCLARPATAGHQWEVVTGPVPVGEALDRAAARL